ncbi:FAD-binding protein [Streptomyces sp. MBT65]|uniref:L-aspartate oxidase n=1 Tax=Streptomyces sp. MBT65 TaxID=1488395 RepID=UPI00190A2C19|nr:FAD-binding protein [Streptomyces sp. MBT65]MBK3573072.1 FAD-binding protein [Streptomyces sp. MBT65]
MKTKRTTFGSATASVKSASTTAHTAGTRSVPASRAPRVIVVGAGGAGLAAAIEAAAEGAHVVLVTKAVYEHARHRWASAGGCTWKTHAFNAAVAPDDSIEAHIKDTLAGGAFAGDEDIVRTLCQGAYGLVEWLEGLGLAFEKGSDGQFATRPFGGNGAPRAVHLEDRLGFHIQRVLGERLAGLVEEGRVEVRSGLRATEILLDADGKVCGLEALSVESLEILEIAGDAVILADGGGTSMYAPSAASTDKTCDGLALGLRAGAEAIDMEYVQFHPTGLASDVPTYDGMPVEEAVRFDGATLLNRDGERFMLRYDPLGERATRDKVSRGAYREIMEGRGFPDATVHLDLGACAHVIPERYPALYERLRLIRPGFGAAGASVLAVRPTAHFLMGGLRIDSTARTTIPGLYAAGETAGGVHGANRLGGNGLSEALVFGRIAGRHAAAVRAGTGSSATPGEQHIRVTGPYRMDVSPDGACPEALLQLLRREMYLKAGPIRTARGLLAMTETIAALDERREELDIASGPRAAGQVQTCLDLGNLLLASRLIVESALLREESRGAHHREDFPSTADHVTGNAVVHDSGKLVWKPVRRGEAGPHDGDGDGEHRR